jgi:hypothetical protein
MGKLVREPALRRQMGATGRSIAEERFSFSAAGKVFLDTYDQVLNGNTQSESLVNNPVSGLRTAVAE